MNFRLPIILASKSPRRQWLLKEAGFNFEIKTKDTPEIYPKALSVYQVPSYLAALKAEDLQSEVSPESLIIAADTVVIQHNKLLGKPQNRADAVQMIEQLSGARHEVVTGVCLLSANKKVVFDDITEVYFKPLSSTEINWYIDQYQPFDKAGAYGAQEWIGMVKIDKLVGSYFNVMGLPVHRLYEELIQF